MRIRLARTEDIPRMAEIYEKARAAIRALGIDQWQTGGPGAGTARADIENGISYVLESNGVVVATAAVYVGHEPSYDAIYGGRWVTDNERYGVIHRIAVAPEARNSGAASSIMSFCGKLARGEGVTSLRCDTHEGNVVMRHTLEKNGYVYCGVIYLPDGSPRVGYEKICP